MCQIPASSSARTPTRPHPLHLAAPRPRVCILLVVFHNWLPSHQHMSACISDCCCYDCFLFGGGRAASGRKLTSDGPCQGRRSNSSRVVCLKSDCAQDGIKRKRKICQSESITGWDQSDGKQLPVSKTVDPCLTSDWLLVMWGLDTRHLVLRQVSIQPPNTEAKSCRTGSRVSPSCLTTDAQKRLLLAQRHLLTSHIVTCKGRGQPHHMANSSFNALSCLVEAKASDLLQSLGRREVNGWARGRKGESTQNSSGLLYPGNLTKLSREEERWGEEGRQLLKSNDSKEENKEYKEAWCGYWAFSGEDENNKLNRTQVCNCDVSVGSDQSVSNSPSHNRPPTFWSSPLLG